MFSGYLYSFDGEDIVLYLSFLRAGAYDFYLYGHGGPGVNAANSVFRLTSGTRNYGSLATTTGPGWASPAWQEGMQYVVFRNVLVAGGDSVVVRVSRGGYTQPALSGMQIESLRPDPPRIDREPPAISRVEAGSTAVLSVSASGGQPLQYQWYREGPIPAGQTEGSLFLIPGATSATLVFPSVEAGNESYYRVNVKNADGSVWSQRAFLDVLPVAPPAIVVAPASQTVQEGRSVVLSVVASGAGPFSYRWSSLSTSAVLGTEASLLIPEATLEHGGQYYVEVGNAGGNTRSGLATLTVVPIPFEELRDGDLVNIDFGGFAPSNKTGPAAIGINFMDFWNAYQPRIITGVPTGSGTVSNLLKSTGLRTRMDLAVENAMGAALNRAKWDPMFESYVFSTDGGPILVNLRQVESGYYDIWLYGHGGPDQPLANTAFQLTAGDGVFRGPLVTGTSSFWSSPELVEGRQYVAFREVFVDGRGEISIRASRSDDSRPYLNGIQLLRRAAAPPQILRTPSSRIVVQGADVEIAVEVSSSTPVTFLWTRDGVPIPEASTSVLRLRGVLPSDTGEYRLEARNVGGSVRTEAIRLIVRPGVAPVIVQQPVGGQATLGGRFALSVEVFSVLPARFQWFKDGVAVSGATGSVLDLLAFKPSDEGLYRVDVSNDAGKVASVGVRVTPLPVAPVLVVQPRNVTVEVGGVATFLVSALQGDLLSYVWYKGNVPIPGATASTLEFPRVTLQDAGTYRVEVRNRDRVVSSDAALLTVVPAPANPSTLDVSDLINIDYGASAVSGKIGRAATGRTPSDFWNAYERRSLGGVFMASGSTPNLRKSDGTITAAIVTVTNAGGAFGNGSLDSMYDGYVYSFSGDDFTTEIRGLTPGYYSFFVYGHGGPAVDRANSRFQLRVGNDFVGQRSTTQGSGWNSMIWSEGQQYVLFPNVLVPDGKATITVQKEGYSQGFLNGLQIVREPGPGNLPPEIIVSPHSVSVEAGAPVRFTVTAAGGGTLRYRWLFQDSVIPGATGPALDLSVVNEADAGIYYVEVSNGYGSVQSSAARLEVRPAPTRPLILRQPESLSVIAGDPATIRVEASGSEPLSYAWYFEGSLLAGATEATLTLARTDSALAGRYKVEVRNRAGFVSSENAVLTVRIPTEETGGTVLFLNRLVGTLSVPVFGSDGKTRLAGTNFLARLDGGAPGSAMKPLGRSAPFRSGDGAGFWDATPDSLRHVPDVAPGSRAVLQVKVWNFEDGPTYEAAERKTDAMVGASDLFEIVTGGAGLPPSLPSLMYGLRSFSVGPLRAPVITLQPVGQFVDAGAELRLSVGIAGHALSYQWYHDGNPIPGAVADALVVPRAGLDDRGIYFVTATNLLGSVTSKEVDIGLAWDRVLALGEAMTSSEGTIVTLPLRLTSNGEVRGGVISIQYESSALTAPEFRWSEPLRSRASIQSNLKSPGAIDLSFALGGEGFVSGEVELGTVSFRLRSVPQVTSARVGLNLASLVDLNGKSVLPRTAIQGTRITIKPRELVGDGNGNGRLDVGDATLVLRFLDHRETAEPWDVKGNDLDGNGELDSADATQILRVTVGLRKVAPRVAPAWTAADERRLFSTSPAADAAFAVEPSLGGPGEVVHLRVRLRTDVRAVAGASFSLAYDPTAFRLLDASDLRVGLVVPDSAMVVWNASAASGVVESSGSIRFAAATAEPWARRDGLLADVALAVLPGAGAKSSWTFRLSALETTGDGHDLWSGPNLAQEFKPRPSAPPRLVGFARFGNGGWVARLNAWPGAKFRLEVSADLVGWAEVASEAGGADGVVGFVIPPPTEATARFFRAVRLD